MYMNINVDQSGKFESTGPDLTKVHPDTANNNSQAKLVRFLHPYSFNLPINTLFDIITSFIEGK